MVVVGSGAGGGGEAAAALRASVSWPCERLHCNTQAVTDGWESNHCELSVSDCCIKQRQAPGRAAHSCPVSVSTRQHGNAYVGGIRKQHGRVCCCQFRLGMCGTRL